MKLKVFGQQWARIKPVEVIVNPKVKRVIVKGGKLEVLNTRNDTNVRQAGNTSNHAVTYKTLPGGVKVRVAKKRG